jgi:hypothetical protein
VTGLIPGGWRRPADRQAPGRRDFTGDDFLRRCQIRKVSNIAKDFSKARVGTFAQDFCNERPHGNDAISPRLQCARDAVAGPRRLRRQADHGNVPDPGEHGADLRRLRILEHQ